MSLFDLLAPMWACFGCCRGQLGSGQHASKIFAPPVAYCCFLSPKARFTGKVIWLIRRGWCPLTPQSRGGKTLLALAGIDLCKAGDTPHSAWSGLQCGRNFWYGVGCFRRGTFRQVFVTQLRSSVGSEPCALRKQRTVCGTSADAFECKTLVNLEL